MMPYLFGLRPAIGCHNASLVNPETNTLFPLSATLIKVWLWILEKFFQTNWFKLILWLPGRHTMKNLSAPGARLNFAPNRFLKVPPVEQSGSRNLSK